MHTDGWRQNVEVLCCYAPNPLEDDCLSLLRQTRLPRRATQSPPVVLKGIKQQSRSRGSWILNDTLSVRPVIPLGDKWELTAD
jgi:hypothetical protein